MEKERRVPNAHPPPPRCGCTGLTRVIGREFDDNGDNYVEMDEWLYHVLGHTPDVRHAELDSGSSPEQYEKETKNRWANQLHDADSDKDGRLSFQVTMKHPPL